MRAVRKSRTQTRFGHAVFLAQKLACMRQLFGFDIFARRNLQVFSKPTVQRCGTDKVYLRQLADRVNPREILVDVRKDHAQFGGHLG